MPNPSDILGFPLWLRWRLYTLGVLPRCSSRKPVISVGGITLGGAGKTPLVEYVARFLLAHGITPAILTRGYLRRCRDDVIIRGEAADWRVVGDEPALLAKKLPEAVIAVGAKRCRLLPKLEEKADVIILDDGFQHLAVERTLDLVALTGGEERMWLFPLGYRRDGLWRLKRLGRNATVVLFGEGDIGRIIPRHVPVFRARLVPTRLHPLSDWSASLPKDAIRGKRVFIAAGIARPRRLRKTVEELGATVVGEAFFLDHRFFRPSQVARVIKSASEAGAQIIVTTQKDAVRIGDIATEDFLALEVQVAVDDEGRFEDVILGAACGINACAHRTKPTY